MAEKYLLRAASAMNYVFLRKVVGKQELDGVIRDELCIFFEEISNLKEIPNDYYNLVKSEMEEGDYIEHADSIEKFQEALADTVGYVMGHVDETIYNLYSYIAGTLAEEENHES